MKLRQASKKAAVAAAVCVLGLISAQAAWAQPMPNVFTGGNLFTITDHLDTSPVHLTLATQLICFSAPVPNGTHFSGFWFSLSFPDWNGRYTQEGDLVRMHGDFFNDTGHDHMRFNLATMSATDSAMGDWDEWIEDGGFGITIVWSNAELNRVGFCPAFSSASLLRSKEAVGEADQEEDPLDMSRKVPPRLLKDGRVATSPGDPEQESLEEYLERTGQTHLLNGG